MFHIVSQVPIGQYGGAAIFLKMYDDHSIKEVFGEPQLNFGSDTSAFKVREAATKKNSAALAAGPGLSVSHPFPSILLHSLHNPERWLRLPPWVRSLTCHSSDSVESGEGLGLFLNHQTLT